MKSVLHAALIAPNGYTNSAYMRGFLENGFADYRMFDWQLQMFQNGVQGMRMKLIYEAEAYNPELIFLHVQSADILDIETVKKLSSLAFTVLYTFDVRTKEKTEWLYELAPYLGLVCVACEEDVAECKNRGINNVMVLQSSADTEIYKKYPGIHGNKNNIAFIGNNYTNTNLNFELSGKRYNMVKFLEENYPDKFKAYGIGWQDGKLINPQEEINIYNRCAIAINQNNFDRLNYTSDRLWRIMATGAFCITKYFKGIENIFENGVHLSWFKTLDQLKHQIDYYLANPLERERIASFGSTYVRGKHNWSERIKQLMVIVEKQRKINGTPCLQAHVVKGLIPTDSESFNETVCDCGKFLFKYEECGCTNKTWQIRMYQNPNK